MGKFKTAALAATAMMAATALTPTGAQAATYIWNGGNYTQGSTSPNPLLAGDILSIQTGANKFFGVDFTNTSGQVDWQAGAIYLSGGATVSNAGLWNALGDNGLSLATGGGTFVNTGTFRKSGGTGVTIIGTAFVNTGQIDAATGTINFNGAGLVFNSGTSFTGAGINQVSNNADFTGAIASTNLDFAGGTYTGIGAALSGTADFQQGTFAGGWTIGSGATLNVDTASNKFIGGAFTNDGSVVWNAGAIYLQGGADVVNNGSWAATGDNGLYPTTGGGTFTNNAVFAKTGGTGVTIVNSAFVNNGQIDAATGTINFNGAGLAFNTGTSFTGAGINQVSNSAAFTGAIASTNLDFAGGTYTGTGAALSGTADFQHGTFAGGWTIGSGATLNVETGANKFIGGAFTNAGSVVWNAGALYLQGGADVVNNGSWTATGDNGLYLTTGGGTFTNNAVFAKTGGAGITVVNSPFVNNGQIDAATGTINFSGSGLVFNSGTSFTGAGVNQVTGSADFIGAIASANLDFTGATYTGTGAVLSGTADFRQGTFAGDWTIGSGATLNVETGANKFVNDSFTNAGTVNWNAGALYLGGAAAVVNAGTINATSDDGIYQNTGGGALTNTGLIRKTGGTGTTTLANSNLSNTGTIDVQTGTIALPGNFVNAGTLAGTGTYSVIGTLTNDGTVAPGLGGTGIGTLSLTGNYAQGASGLFSVGFGPGGTVDLLNISGTAALNGSLGLNCLGCSFNVGDVFTILDSVGDLSGTFANSAANGFLDGFAYSVVYDTALDRVQVRIDNVGTPPVSGAVPEPATWAMMLLGFGAVGSVLRRRRDRAPRVRCA